MKGTKEFQDLQAAFEDFAKKTVWIRGRLDRDGGGIPGVEYQDGGVNAAFQAFAYGYAYGKCVHRN